MVNLERHVIVHPEDRQRAEETGVLTEWGPLPVVETELMPRGKVVLIDPAEIFRTPEGVL